MDDVSMEHKGIGMHIPAVIGLPIKHIALVSEMEYSSK